MRARRFLPLGVVALSSAACLSEPAPPGAKTPEPVATAKPAPAPAPSVARPAASVNAPPPTGSTTASTDGGPPERPFVVCTEKGCNSGVWFWLDVPLPESDVPKARVRACRNGTCVEAIFAGQMFPEVGGRVLPTKPIAGRLKDWAVECVGQKTRQGFYVELAWGSVRWDGPKPGDRYTVAIVDGRGKVVSKLDERINEYVEHYPNGKECDGNPCLQKLIDKRRVDH